MHDAPPILHLTVRAARQAALLMTSLPSGNLTPHFLYKLTSLHAVQQPGATHRRTVHFHLTATQQIVLYITPGTSTQLQYGHHKQQPNHRHDDGFVTREASSRRRPLNQSATARPVWSRKRALTRCFPEDTSPRTLKTDSELLTAQYPYSCNARSDRSTRHAPESVTCYRGTQHGII